MLPQVPNYLYLNICMSWNKLYLNFVSLNQVLLRNLFTWSPPISFMMINYFVNLKNIATGTNIQTTVTIVSWMRKICISSTMKCIYSLSCSRLNIIKLCIFSSVCSRSTIIKPCIFSSSCWRSFWTFSFLSISTSSV